jgi:hypothetical protein
VPPKDKEEEKALRGQAFEDSIFCHKVLNQRDLKKGVRNFGISKELSRISKLAGFR